MAIAHRQPLRVMMRVFRHGPSYRVAFDSGLRHVLLGLIPGTGRTDPKVIALRTTSNSELDPLRIKREVTQALADVAREHGLQLPIDAIEYVPSDSPYYEKYYSLARELALYIARDQGLAR